MNWHRRGTESRHSAYVYTCVAHERPDPYKKLARNTRKRHDELLQLQYRLTTVHATAAALPVDVRTKFSSTFKRRRKKLSTYTSLSVSRDLTNMGASSARPEGCVTP